MDYLDHSSYVLEELDLSWNNIRPSNFAKLMNVLSQNVILRVLNLSWNLIIEGSEANTKS